MDNEQLMLNLFKQQQYTVTRAKLQKVFLMISAATSAFGILVTLVFYINQWYVYAFLGVIVCVAIGSLLVWLKVLKIHTASLLVLLYCCFVFIPGLWLITGIYGAGPMVSLVILVSIITLFSGKILKWVLTVFCLLVVLLTINSAVAEFPVAENVTFLIYIIAAYLTTVLAIVLYMLNKQKEFEELNDKFLRNSFKDELTQLYNRKLLDLIIEYQESLYKREKKDYILVMFDADNFKNLNDTHGHIFGDVVLRTIAQCIQDNARASDFTVRYGGDEFLLIQCDASELSINAFIQRIEKAMEHSCTLDIDISVSYGFAARSECKTPKDVLVLADERLYESKQAKKAAAKLE